MYLKITEFDTKSISHDCTIVIIYISVEILNKSSDFRPSQHKYAIFLSSQWLVFQLFTFAIWCTR